MYQFGIYSVDGFNRFVHKIEHEDPDVGFDLAVEWILNEYQNPDREDLKVVSRFGQALV